MREKKDFSDAYQLFLFLIKIKAKIPTLKIL